MSKAAFFWKKWPLIALSWHQSRACFYIEKAPIKNTPNNLINFSTTNCEKKILSLHESFVKLSFFKPFFSLFYLVKADFSTKVSDQRQRNAHNFGGPVVKELHLVSFCLFLIRENLGGAICLLKVAFFQKWDSFFKSPNLQNKLLQITILNLKFEIPAHNSKQLIQISSSG